MLGASLKRSFAVATRTYRCRSRPRRASELLALRIEDVVAAPFLDVVYRGRAPAAALRSVIVSSLLSWESSQGVPTPTPAISRCTGRASGQPVGVRRPAIALPPVAVAQTTHCPAPAPCRESSIATVRAAEEVSVPRCDNGARPSLAASAYRDVIVPIGGLRLRSHVPTPTHVAALAVTRLRSRLDGGSAAATARG